MKRTLLFIMSLLLLIGTQVSAQTQIAGTNVYWQQNGTTLNFTVSGEGDGAIPDNLSPRPWNSLAGTIETIEIGEGITAVGSGSFGSFSALTTVSLPSTLTRIGASVFYYCHALTSITIPEGVESIGDDAFAESPFIVSVTVGWDDPTEVSYGSALFHGLVYGNATLNVPAGTKALYTSTAPWSSFSSTNIIEAEPEAITITSVFPEEDATDVPVDTDITITFSGDITAYDGSVTASIMNYANPYEGTVTATIENNVITIEYDEPLDYETEYEVFIAGGELNE